MVAALVDSTSSGVSDGQSESRSVNVPTGAAAGQVAILILEMWLDTATNPNVTYPAGFSQVANFISNTDGFQKIKVAIKELTGADAGTYNMTWTGQGSFWNQAHCVLASGVDVADFVINTAQDPSGTDLPANSLNTPVDGCFILHTVANENSSTGTPPTGYTEIEESNYLKTNYKIGGTAGTESISGGSVSTSTLKLGVLLALRPESSGITLTINDAFHSTVADNVDLTQVHSLAVQDAVQVTVADQLTLTQAIDLIIQDAVQAQVATAPDLTQVHQIVIHDSFLVQVTDNVDLTQQHQLQVQDAIQATAADNITLNDEPEPPGERMTISDIQLTKLRTITGNAIGSLTDLLHQYYGSLSGLAPATAFSLSDHQRTYWQVQTGASGSISDLERAFYDLQAVPAGSLSDREYEYWFGL